MRVIFGHVEREAAAAAGLVVIVGDAGVVAGRCRQPRQQIGVLAQVGLDKEAAHRRQLGRQRIECFQRTRDVTQRAKHAEEIAFAVLNRTQPSIA